MVKIRFQIVTPERVVLSQEVDSVTCPTTTGQITVLPGHVPLVSSLEQGELVIKVNGQEQYMAVSGGFVEVKPGNEVIILADTVERAEEIDEQRAEQARQRAKESMQKRHIISEEEYAKIAAALQKNLARLRVVRRASRRGAHHLDQDTNVS